jgi:hypothetical protein
MRAGPSATFHVVIRADPDRLAKRSSRAGKPFKTRQVTTVAFSHFLWFFTQRVTNLWLALLSKFSDLQLDMRFEIDTKQD